MCFVGLNRTATPLSKQNLRQRVLQSVSRTSNKLVTTFLLCLILAQEEVPHMNEHEEEKARKYIPMIRNSRLIINLVLEIELLIRAQDLQQV